jgi:hypothetical protein
MRGTIPPVTRRRISGWNCGSLTIASTWVVFTAPAGDCLSGAQKSGQSAP